MKGRVTNFTNALQNWRNKHGQTLNLHRVHGTVLEHRYVVADWHVMWQTEASLGQVRALAGRSLIFVVLAGLTVPAQVSARTSSVRLQRQG